MGQHRREDLIARRVHLDFSQESLAHHLGISVSAVASWERGRRVPMPGMRRSLAEALQLSLMELDRLLGIEAPVALNSYKVPRWLNTYESLVQEVGHLGEVEVIGVPGLLQTRRYAQAAEQTTEMKLTHQQVLERVDIRLTRQSVLYRESSPLRVTALLSEGVLQDCVGGCDVMVEQLDHLLELAQLPNVDLRILAPGRAPAAIGGFELLTRRGDSDPFMAVTFSVDGATYIDSEERVSKFATRFDHLVSVTLSPDESTRRIRHMREKHYDAQPHQHVAQVELQR